MSGEKGGHRMLHPRPQGSGPCPRSRLPCPAAARWEIMGLPVSHGTGLSGAWSPPWLSPALGHAQFGQTKAQRPQVLPCRKNLLPRLNKHNHINEAIYLLLSNSLSTSKGCYTALFLVTLLRCFTEYQMKIQLSLKFKKTVHFFLCSYNICNWRKGSES